MVTDQSPIKDQKVRPDTLLKAYSHLLTSETIKRPILDLACGDGHNGIFLALRGLDVVLADKAEETLQAAKKSAEINHADVRLWQVDLEQEGENPLTPDSFGAILVFRYLHRPLMPCIKKAVARGGVLFYETYTTQQTSFGRPHNPDFLLKPGELPGWFEDWRVYHSFEGILEKPKRAVAQIVCRKPGPSVDNLGCRPSNR